MTTARTRNPDSPRRPSAGQVHRVLTYLPDAVFFSGALLCAVLGAVLVGSLSGCGGGVGSEGTGSFAASYSQGTISGFGSIVVNGVHYDESSASVTDDDGQSLDRATLSLGMVVEVNGGAVGTAADGTATATASSVRALRALVGPASAVDTVAGRLRVLGQAVRVTADTVLAGSLPGGLAGVTTGQVLEVYGYYDSSRQAYLATRIAPAPAAAGYRVSGPVASVDGGQRFTMGDQHFAGPTSGLAPGSLVRLAVQPAPDSDGRWVVSAQRAEDRPPEDRDGAGLEGMVSAVSSATRFVVGGVTVDSSAAQVQGTVQVGAQVEVRGSLRAGLLAASAVTVGGGEARRFELKGSFSQHDVMARRFTLRGITVSYAGAGVMFRNGSAMQLMGYTGQLEVKGTLSADRTQLDATEIRFE